MHGYKTSLTLAAALLALAAQGAEFNGARALEHTRRAVALGPRPPGSPALEKLRGYMAAELKPRGCQLSFDAFTAETPEGPIPMKNVICRFPGSSGRAVVFSGHYDTKLMRDARFVGADDGGSSTGFLLEMATALQGRPRRDDVYLVWFDGEEAFRQWTATDSLYGSRHLAERWAADGTLGRVKALINVDMIGDKDLDIMKEGQSTAALGKLVWDTAYQNGYGKYFLPTGGGTDDDHMPFIHRGVNALDLIDFDKTYWHTAGDTMDKLGAHSFEVVGAVLLKVLDKLEGQP